jgi:hypothetical protein
MILRTLVPARADITKITSFTVTGCRFDDAAEMIFEKV